MNSNKSKIQLINGGSPLEMQLIETSYNFIGVRNFRDNPKVTSKILNKVDLSKIQVKLIEIGNVETIGKETDFWYKVKINDIEGWIFGGLSLNN